MTPRERARQGLNGSSIEPRPVLSLVPNDPDADVVIGTSGNSSQMVLFPITNPFGLALESGVDLNDVLSRDPAAGGAVLDGFIAETRAQIQHGVESDADGVFYVVHGARADQCSPMQYGGYYLEHDRALLAEVPVGAVSAVFVPGGEDAYIDFVSDLPAQLFVWDSAASGISSAELRQMRSGTQASADPESEFFFVPSTQALPSLKAAKAHV